MSVAIAGSVRPETYLNKCVMVLLKVVQYTLQMVQFSSTKRRGKMGRKKIHSSPRFPVSPPSLQLGSAFPAKGPTPLHSSQVGTAASPDLSQFLP